MSALFRVVGGTDAGDVEAPSVWEDDEKGAARVLRGAAQSGLVKVALIGADANGDLYVASTARSAEETMGFFLRGIGYLERMTEEGGGGRPSSDDKDGA
jgi:hypothetical protein